MLKKLGLMLAVVALAAGAVFVPALLTGGAAQAEASDLCPGWSPGPDPDACYLLRRSVVESAARVIGIPIEDVRFELCHGMTLAQIGLIHGVGTPHLKAGILFDESLDLARLVREGVITPYQAARVQFWLTLHIDEIVHRSGGCDGPLA